MIPVRRLGSSVIHWVDLSARGDEPFPVTVFGAPAEAIAAPVLASCGTLLRGHVVVMARFRFAGSCSRCRRNPAVADAARTLEGVTT